MDEIGLIPNLVMVTCSGTNGRVQILPEYMKGWAASQDALRIEGIDENAAGYIYAWLSGPYGQTLIRRHQYGSVITHLDRDMLGAVAVPLLTRQQRNSIAALVLKANQLRNDAWSFEQGALAALSKEIARAPTPEMF
jgi:type I restriction enzyme S subunit